MLLRQMTIKDYAKAIGVGIATALILSMVMIPAFKAGISPQPKPLGLAFAQVLLGQVSLLVGILFHVAYVTFRSAVYIVVFKRRTFLNTLWLALGLWLMVLVIFFPLCHYPIGYKPLGFSNIGDKSTRMT